MLRPRFVGPAIGALSFACAIVLPLGSHAQTSAIVAPGFVSKPVLVSPITGDETKEIVVIAVTIAPGASSPAHTHPGDCIVTVSEGAVELRIEGKEPRRLAAGDAFVNPSGPVHQFTNVGATPAHLTRGRAP